ncbi:hypothetical protein DL93DRAFT_784598 [Clavulina sp. PMI_390]|nr:hypothetical protein DL93DRAFT_784598 [Clavulina sp. PMI_390]
MPAPVCRIPCLNWRDQSGYITRLFRLVSSWRSHFQRRLAQRGLRDVPASLVRMFTRTQSSSRRHGTVVLLILSEFVMMCVERRYMTVDLAFSASLRSTFMLGTPLFRGGLRIGLSCCRTPRLLYWGRGDSASLTTSTEEWSGKLRRCRKVLRVYRNGYAGSKGLMRAPIALVGDRRLGSRRMLREAVGSCILDEGVARDVKGGLRKPARESRNDDQMRIRLPPHVLRCQIMLYYILDCSSAFDPKPAH